jgi:hypothetical protein
MICGKPVKPAKNGVDRGLCTRPAGHTGKHSSMTCIECGIALTKKNAPPSRLAELEAPVAVAA